MHKLVQLHLFSHRSWLACGSEWEEKIVAMQLTTSNDDNASFFHMLFCYSFQVIPSSAG